ncbi:uncharacterized protein CEXT_89211 [Caerostris extrusa]|uniref:Uncharacterized protein n=1 Tax=Caerostris extrusa TaxID=172846 RepID=A0AAV4UR11_CAEEX|nr:uncharacterized protein CEXT_89211 [Caerostris extrusa]
MKLIRETELKSMCINTIVKHIDLYVKPNEAIETFLEYLKRCFSDRLFNLLERKTLFPETYLEFLLTPHWKNVSMSSCIDYSFTRLMSKFQIMGQAKCAWGKEVMPLWSQIVALRDGCEMVHYPCRIRYPCTSSPSATIFSYLHCFVVSEPPNRNLDSCFDLMEL